MQKRPLQIQLYGSPILRKKCRKVEKVTSEIHRILDEMASLMRKQHGVGLAANQAGLDIALVVAEADDRLYKFINPRITKKQGKISFAEGCLSFPGLELSISRAEEVWVSYLDEQGRDKQAKVGGVLAVILQHEIDHINAVLFIDKVSFFKRLKIRKKLKKIQKLYQQGQAKE